MSRPPENIEVWCPQCHHFYQDWRRSVNLDLDKTFDEEYVDQ